MSLFREVVARQSGDRPSSVQGHANAIAWSTDGKLATGTTDGWILISELDSYGNARMKSKFVAHGSKKDVEGLEWHPSDKNQLASCSTDKSLKIWDVRSPSGPVQQHTSDVDNLSVTYSPDGRYVAMGSVRKEKSVETDILGIYDLRTKSKLKSVKFNNMVNDYRWSPSGEYIITTGEKGAIEVMSFGGPRLALVRSLVAHAGASQGLDIDPCNRYLGCGGTDGLVSLWEMDDMVCVRTIERCETPIRFLSFNHDGRLLAIGSDDKTVDIAEVDTGTCAHTIETSCTSAKWHPFRPILAGVVSRPSRGDYGLRLWSFLE